MNLRLAAPEDLPAIQEMYRKLICKMDEDGMGIWDDIYPCEFFADDIAGQALYILVHGASIVGAFALCSSHSGESHVKWEDGGANAAYIDRLGVHVDFAKQGIGTSLLHHAANIARERGAEYLRLFVIDRNLPATNLYLKSGFTKAQGQYVEVIDETLSFREHGFEKKL